ncbi:helix-turn-helix transcriptional regulator [Pseudomonas atagonensis]|uniref:helix-turn-helix transcriptional regulator n=1 Tax=Pseudomonas atagonensis TaxID=2609964 RepID=UPI001FE5453F|nr:LuxR C-terminal-related transcriptional regulator [Pseudomonas atagonensis]
MLLEDDLYECESATLALIPQEIAQALRHLPPEQADSIAVRIVQRTSGWCAGVRMALLQKCDWSQGSQSQQRVDTLLDYLEHELFSNLTAEQAEVWRVLAHMPRFNAPLCEHLFGAGEGAQHLRWLQVLGCFIEPWQASSEWLRVFPPLSRVMRDAHGSSGRSWHRRACQWFTASQDWRSAFEQALLAEEYEVAVSLLQHLSFEHLFEDQTVVLLLKLYEQQGEESFFGAAQRIGMITAALLFAGRFDQAAGCIEQLCRFSPQPAAHSQRQLVARWQAQQGWLLHVQGRKDSARQHFLEALAELDCDQWILRVLCLSGLTQQALQAGELNAAQALNRDALCLARERSSLVFEGLLELDHAQLLEQRGAFVAADNLLAGVQTLLMQCFERPVPLLGRIALRRGRLTLFMGQDEHAAEWFQGGLADCLHSHDKQVFNGFLGQAYLAANRQDYAQAFMRLREAERLMQQWQIPDCVYRGALLQVSCQLWLQQGRTELVLEAATRVLRHFRGAQARQAPPATISLIARIECLLVLAQVQLQCAVNPQQQLSDLAEQARHTGARGLETELQLAMAEVYWVHGSHALAKVALNRGLELIRHCHAPFMLRQSQLRLPELFRIEGTSGFIENDSKQHVVDALLSAREEQVLKLIASGHSNQQIAEHLYISLHTVKTHVRRIYGKLAVERRTHAVAKARLLGFL